MIPTNMMPPVTPPQNVFAQRLAMPPQSWRGTAMPPVSGGPMAGPMPVTMKPPGMLPPQPGPGMLPPTPMPGAPGAGGPMPPTMMPPRPGPRGMLPQGFAAPGQPSPAQIPQNAMRQRLMMTA